VQENHDVEKTCNFCGIYDKNFTEESLDIHYWRDCPMLTCCWECDQVIEIKSIEEHLLEECRELNKYMYHPKCK
jgi:centrosomal protein CEP104